MLRIGDIVSFCSAEDYAAGRGEIKRSDLLQLVNGGTFWDDLRFLVADRSNVTRLRVSGLIHGFKGLDQLCELAELDIGDYAPSPVRDFSPLQHLTVCKMGWAKSIDSPTFFSLPSLRAISLLRYTAEDCADIGNAVRLKALTLRHSKLLSLKGIETCSQLEELRLLRVKGLRSLDGVEHCTQLRILEIDRGSAPVGVADVLCRLEGLEEVYFEGDFVLEHLRWLVRNRQMRSFRSDAVVIDVDWTKVFESPLLREIAFRHQPGALQRDTDIAQIAASFGRPLKWVEHGGTSKRPWVELHFVGG